MILGVHLCVLYLRMCHIASKCENGREYTARRAELDNNTRYRNKLGMGARKARGWGRT